MLLLLVAFRSVVIAVTAAAMNLLSVAAAYGVVAFFLEAAGPAGWSGSTPPPVAAFVPVLMFAVLFGLSMDYEVFLISRMRESWVRPATTAGHPRGARRAPAGHHRGRGHHGRGLRGVHPDADIG